MASPKSERKKGSTPRIAARLVAPAARLNQAVRDRDAARSDLARRSRPSDPHHIVDASLTWLENTLEKERDRLLSFDGVVGVGLGFRVSKGTQTREPCITVLVKKKFSPDKLRKSGHRSLPKSKRVGKRTVRIDVVQLGELEPHVGVGSDIGPEDSNLAGTLGVFARDTATNGTVAVTAMHVSGRTNVPTAAVPFVNFCSPSRFTDGTSPVFAQLVLGTKTQIDAAKLNLSAPQASGRAPASPGGVIPGLGPIGSWRPLTFPGDMLTTVFMSGAVSGLTQGFISNTSMDLPTDNLKSTIIVNIPSMPGDSGAVLVDSQRFVLGFLVGAGNAALGQNLRIFCPAGLVFALLGCDIP